MNHFWSHLPGPQKKSHIFIRLCCLCVSFPSSAPKSTSWNELSGVPRTVVHGKVVNVVLPTALILAAVLLLTYCHATAQLGDGAASGFTQVSRWNMDKHGAYGTSKLLDDIQVFEAAREICPCFWSFVLQWVQWVKTGDPKYKGRGSTYYYIYFINAPKVQMTIPSSSSPFTQWYLAPEKCVFVSESLSVLWSRNHLRLKNPWFT